MESLDYWRLCDQLSVIQAALLVAGCEPSSDAAYIERWDRRKGPVDTRRQRPQSRTP